MKTQIFQIILISIFVSSFHDVKPHSPTTLLINHLDPAQPEDGGLIPFSSELDNSCVDFCSQLSNYLGSIEQVDCVTLYNRGSEVEWLRKKLASRRGKIIAISGPPKSGKSALVRRVSIEDSARDVQSWFKIDLHNGGWKTILDVHGKFISTFGAQFKTDVQTVKGWARSLGMKRFELFGAEFDFEDSNADALVATLQSLETMFSDVTTVLLNSRMDQKKPVVWVDGADLLNELDDEEVFKMVSWWILKSVESGHAHFVLSGDLYVHDINKEFPLTSVSIGHLPFEKANSLWNSECLSQLLESDSIPDESFSSVYERTGGKIADIFEAYETLLENSPLDEAQFMIRSKSQILEAFAQDKINFDTMEILYRVLTEKCVSTYKLKELEPEFQTLIDWGILIKRKKLKFSDDIEDCSYDPELLTFSSPSMEFVVRHLKISISLNPGGYLKFSLSGFDGTEDGPLLEIGEQTFPAIEYIQDNKVLMLATGS